MLILFTLFGKAKKKDGDRRKEIVSRILSSLAFDMQLNVTLNPYGSISLQKRLIQPIGLDQYVTFNKIL